MRADRPSSKPLAYHQLWNSFWLLATDCLVLLCMLYLGDLAVYHLHGVPVSLRYSLLLLPAWCAAATVSGLAPGWGLGAVEELRRIELLLAALFAGAGVAALLLRGMPSRIVFLGGYAASAVMIPFGRVLCRKLLVRFGGWGCPVAVYGERERLGAVLAVLAGEPAIGYHPCGVFADDVPLEGVGGVPLLGRFDDTADGVDVALVATGRLGDPGMARFLDHTLASYRKVVLLPDIGAGVFSWVVPRDFNGMVGLEVTRNLLVPFAAAAKRAYETLLVLLFLPVWLPLVLLLALAVFCADRKAPFYRQERVGRNGRPFRAVKLRTMVPNADAGLERLLESDAALRQEWGTFYKLRNDPRITPVGRLLRRYSLDELPQLLNVLSGGMALVGPRPLPAYHQAGLSEESRRMRAKVRPGITGLWQVSGRSDCRLDEMQMWDSFYIRNWSVWMDLHLLARTVRVVLKGSGAY